MRPQLLLPLCWTFVVLGAPTLVPRTNTGGGGSADNPEEIPRYGSPQQYIEELLPGEEGTYWACMMHPREGGMAYCLKVIMENRKKQAVQPQQEPEPPNDPSINKFSDALDGFARKFNTFKVDQSGFAGLAGRLPKFIPGTGGLAPMLLP